MQGTKTNRERKNGASREQWKERKAAANAARPPQEVYEQILEIGNSRVGTVSRVRE